MNEFEIHMMEKGMIKNIQAKMDKEPSPKKQRREYQLKSDLQAYVRNGLKMVQAFRNWIRVIIKRKQNPLLQ